MDILKCTDLAKGKPFCEPEINERAEKKALTTEQINEKGPNGWIEHAQRMHKRRLTIQRQILPDEGQQAFILETWENITWYTSWIRGKSGPLEPSFQPMRSTEKHSVIKNVLSAFSWVLVLVSCLTLFLVASVVRIEATGLGGAVSLRTFNPEGSWELDRTTI